MAGLKSLAAALMLACMGSATVAQERALVIAVNHPLAYFAERLLSEEAEVLFPVPENVDPSFWRPSISDISQIQSADLILLNGAGFATWVDRVSLPRSRLVNTSAALEDRFITTESITHSHGDGGEHAHEGRATYTWLDPSMAIAQAEAIASAIIARDLAPVDSVNARLSDLSNDLNALDAEAARLLDGAQGAAMITTHPRYQYLARRYDLPVTALEWDAGATPSDAQIAALEAMVADTGARILIWEAAPAAEALEAAAALGLQNVIFSPLAHPPESGDYLDALAASFTALAAAVEVGQDG